MTLHTLGIICAALLIANEGAALVEPGKVEWTPRRIIIGIPMTVFVWWLIVTVVF